MSKSPFRLLLDEARRYLTGEYNFPGDQVELWTWQDGKVVPQSIPSDQAEAMLGLRFASRASELAPEDAEAKAVEAALQVRSQLQTVPPDPASGPGTVPDALRSELSNLSVEALSDALTLALQSKQFDVAPALITLLGERSDPASLAVDPRSPLVEALSAPNRSVQLASALAIVALDPKMPFPESSRIVPILSRVLFMGPLPEVVVVSGNSALLNTIGASLKERGFEPITAPSAAEGFARSSESAGVEAVIVDPAFLRGARDARDLLRDLRLDARTAGLPVLLPLPVDPARAIARAQEYGIRQVEREPNDIHVRSSPVAFVGSPRRGHVNGRLSPDDGPPMNQPKRTMPAPEDEFDLEVPFQGLPAGSNNADASTEKTVPVDTSGDLFSLGTLRSGDVLSALIEPSPGSTLRPSDVELWLERRDGPANVTVATGIGALGFRIETTGSYDVRVQAADRHLYGYRASYSLEITVYDYDLAVPAVPSIARLKVEALAGQFDRVGVLTSPADPSAVETALNREWQNAGTAPIPAAEREAQALAAAGAVARLASQPDGPFISDIAAVAPQLERFLSDPLRAPIMAESLAAVPTGESAAGPGGFRLRRFPADYLSTSRRFRVEIERRSLRAPALQFGATSIAPGPGPGG